MKFWPSPEPYKLPSPFWIYTAPPSAPLLLSERMAEFPSKMDWVMVTDVVLP